MYILTAECGDGIGIWYVASGLATVECGVYGFTSC